jgi:peptide/nickel transport system permease protein
LASAAVAVERNLTFIQLKKNKLAIIGLLIISLLVIVAVFAPVLAPHHPYEQDLDRVMMAPCSEYPFGTDDFGRCILSRIIFGTRISLAIGLIVTAISAVAGIILGMLAGFYGGVIDEVIMRIVDIFLAFPGLILALVIAGLLGPGMFNVRQQLRGENIINTVRSFEPNKKQQNIFGNGKAAEKICDSLAC